VRTAWLMLVAVLALAGCTSRTAGDPGTDDSPVVGPVDLVIPIEMRPVLEQTGPSGSPALPPSDQPVATSALPSTTVLPGQGGEQLTLAEPVMTVERLERAEVTMEKTSATWVLVLDLTAEDTAAFAEWTSEHIDERLAMVIDGEVVIAPTIQGAITDGGVQITGNYTQSEIRDLLDKITGR
jgi:preprotein translocase subunit SecD